MVAVSRRNIRSEVIAKALTPETKEATQTPEETYTPTPPALPPAQPLHPKELRSSNDPDRIGATIEFYQSEDARLRAELEALPQWRAEREQAILSGSRYGQASRRASLSRQYRKKRDRIRGEIRTNNERISIARNRLKIVQKAERSGTTPQTIIQKQKKAEALERIAEARRDRNQEAFIQSQGQQAWKEASPEAKKRIRASYKEDVSRPPTITGTTDLNVLAEQYETAGEFLPEVQRRVARGETVSATRRPVSVRLGYPGDFDEPAVQTAEIPEDIRRIREAGGTIRETTPEDRDRFSQSLKRKIERLQASADEGTLPYLKEVFRTDPRLKERYESSFSPEFDRATIDPGSSDTKGDPFTSEYWEAQGRLFTGSFQQTTIGIAGGSQVERAVFGASLVFPWLKKIPGVKQVGKRFSEDSIQALKDAGTATISSLFVGQRDVSGAELAGTATPFVAGGGISAYGASSRVTRDVKVVKDYTKRTREKFDDALFGENPYLFMGFKPGGKRGTRGRKPKSLVQKSKESRGAGLNPNVNFDVQAGQAVIKGRIPFKDAPGLTSKQRRITIRVDPRQLAQPGSPARATSPAQNKLVFTLQERGGQIKVQRQFTTIRELSRYKRSQARAGVGKTPGLKPGEVVVAQRTPSKISKRFADRFKEDKKPTGSQEVSPGTLARQEAQTESVTVFGKRARASTREETAIPDLKKGVFSRLGETLAPRRKTQYQTYELVEQPRAPKGFRPGTYQALRGRYESLKTERQKFLEGLSITPRSEIKIIGAPKSSVTPERVIGINLGSASRSEFSLIPDQDSSIAQEIKLSPAQEIAQTRVQIQAQDQVSDQELAFKRPPVFSVPRTTPLPRAPEPFTPTTRPPKRPPEEKIPRIPPPKTPKKRPPKRSTPPPRVPPPIIPFPKIKLGQAFSPSYDVFANIRGEFQKIGSGLTKSGAITTGVEKISKSALATFKISKTGAFIQEEDEGLNKRTRKLFKQFRKPKPSSKIRNTDFTFIEKRKFRIDTPGELQDITYKGIKASRGRRR